MAVQGLARELSEGRSSTVDREGVRTYRRRFLVVTNNRLDDGNVVKTAAGLPQRYFPYVTSTSVDFKALCTDLNVTQVANTPFHWHVDVTYSTKHKDQEEEQGEDNPLAEPPEIRWEFETVQVPIFGTPDQTVVDPDGDLYTGPIKSSAGEIFNPPPTLDESRPVVTITRNEASYNPDVAIRYQNSVNSDFFQGVKPRQAKMRSISGEYVSEQGLSYWRITYVLAIKFDTWDLRQLNHGSFYLDGSGKKQEFIDKTHGTRYIGFLNTDGTELPTSNITAGTSTPNFLRFRVHREEPFAALQLPLTR